MQENELKYWQQLDMERIAIGQSKAEELKVQQEVEKQQEIDRVKVEQELKRQAEINKQQEIDKQKELKRQAKINKQQEIDEKKEIKRQTEIDKQKELKRQTEIDKQREIEKQQEFEILFKQQIKEKEVVEEEKDFIDPLVHMYEKDSKQVYLDESTPANEFSSFNNTLVRPKDNLAEESKRHPTLEEDSKFIIFIFNRFNDKNDE
jgi:hypothetical protein